ncbi:AraC family transcriptional regulator [Mycobacteroides chelonae]|uniref:AraC family transcriptional regulator n=1 Tax=Mycobacteroides chelonae TaxID=1774 RepID=UPI0008A93F22|nr:AraC family transcriptional regulator [Mycobacteroides chelonae]OHU24869.1 AraC family transcriptional regulator [Mycobacteroides chelonae]
MATDSGTFTLSPAIKPLLDNLGIRSDVVLRQAGLPTDLLIRGTNDLSSEDYFGFWRALENESGHETLPVAIARTLTAEFFDAPIFAALCSPNLNVAAHRISKFKHLIAPIDVRVEEGSNRTLLTYTWLTETPPPSVLITSELLFWTALARLGTRRQVAPLRVYATAPPPQSAAIREYLGTDIEPGPADAIVFSADDCMLPFLTEDLQMWNYFAPQLRGRLSELTRSSPMTERVRTVLLEALPAGQSDISTTARRLITSTRTLQRQLKREGNSFQAVLNKTRESLARHYLSRGDTSIGEIALLLGYEDTNSFYRAFRGWTGQTPERTRHPLR